MNTTLEHKSQTANQRAQQHESQSAKAYPSRTIVHAKLEMTEPGDHDEQEADAVANTIISGEKISRKISGGSVSSGIAVSQQMESRLSQLQGGGRQMPEGLRNMMESGFGQDFSQVRLHTDSEAASMSSSIHAKAFTLGNDIYFNQGQFSPNTTEGQRLVAHELTHVVQGTGKVGRKDEKKNRIHYEKEYYVKEWEWIKKWVLNDRALNVLENNYERSDERVPITVLIYTNELSARHEKEVRGKLSTTEDSRYAFEDSNVDESINGLILKLGKKTLMIQGSPNYYGHKLIDMYYSYGPIENVIVLGHGNSSSVEIDNDYSIESTDEKFFKNVRYVFQKSDKETKNLKHSFLLPECGTGSDFDSNTGLVNSAYIKLNKGRKGKSKVLVEGNIPTVKTKRIKYLLDDDDRLLYEVTDDHGATIFGEDVFDFSEEKDPSPYNNKNQATEPYASIGKNSEGILKSLTHITNGDDSVFCRKDSSFQPYNTVSIKTESFEKKVAIDVFMRFVDSKHCLSMHNRPEAISRIEKMTRMILDNEMFILNTNQSFVLNDEVLLEMVYNSID